jgi:hypothetical protein
VIRAFFCWRDLAKLSSTRFVAVVRNTRFTWLPREVGSQNTLTHVTDGCLAFVSCSFLRVVSKKINHHARRNIVCVTVLAFVKWELSWNEHKLSKGVMTDSGVDAWKRL